MFYAIFAIRDLKIMKKFILIVTCAFMALSLQNAEAQSSGSVTFDKTTHNFGDILHKSGPVSCSFKLSNDSDKPVVIYNVVSSCGCTDVKWTREPIRKGGTGSVSVTYSNDEGAFPFEKSLTVYVSSEKKPVILKIRGISVTEKKPLSEMYPVHVGPLALTDKGFKVGNLEQGESKTESVLVANIGNSPLHLKFEDVSEHLSIQVKPNPIPANSTAELFFTVEASRDLWGKNLYWAVPVCNGNAFKSQKIGFTAFTKENFSHVSYEKKQKGANPKFTSSTFNAGFIKKGSTIKADFTFVNVGKEPLHIYKIDVDAKKWSSTTISDTNPGRQNSFSVEIDTTGMSEGEFLSIITLTTDSPLRPIVNVFVSGWIE